MAVSNKDIKAKLGAALAGSLPPSMMAGEAAAHESAPQPKRREGKGGKTSVNLFEADLELLDPLKDFLKKEGFRKVADSQLMRLLCRDYKPGPTTVETMKRIVKEDGRRKGS